MKSRYLTHITIFVVVILLGYFVYPTPYEYTRKAPDVYRVNRFTGVVEQSTSEGWRTPKQIADDAAARWAEDERKQQEEAEKAQKLAEEQEKRRQEQLGPKTLDSLEFKAGSLKVSVSGSCRYLDGRAVVMIAIKGSSGKATKAEAGALEAILSSPYNRFIIQLTDSTAFILAKHEVRASDFSRQLGENGQVVGIEASADVPMSEAEFRQVSGWTPLAAW